MKTSCKLPISGLFSIIVIAAASVLSCGASTVILNPIADAFVTTGPTGWPTASFKA